MNRSELKNKRIAMLMGGHNAEHEVSLKTGSALSAALRGLGYSMVDLVVDLELPARLKEEKIDVAFVALHGRWGEDGCIQGLLEAMRIPYTGSGVLASALSMDKVMAKWIFRQSGLSVAQDLVLTSVEIDRFDSSSLPFGLPAVVKPSREGSSVGISIAHDQAQLQEALSAAAQLAGDVLIERYIAGREIQVAVLDDRALGAIEVVPGREFYDYTAKYHAQGSTEYLFPAPLSDDERERVLKLCAQAHRSLGCTGISRVDTILDQTGQYYLLEVNTIPGMTEASLVPKIAAGIGLSFADLAERLLLGADLRA